MQLKTLGYLAVQLQKAPGAVELAIRELRIAPGLSLNGLAYFAEPDQARILEWLGEQEIENIRRRAGLASKQEK